MVNKDALGKTLSKGSRNTIIVSLGTATVATIAIIITAVPTIFTYKKPTNTYFPDKKKVNVAEKANKNK